MRTRRRLSRVLVEDLWVEDTISFDLPRAASEVWDFMWDPQSLHVLEADVTYAATLQGTPSRQVGEVQVSMHGTGLQRHLSALEVIALEPGRMAMTRTLTTTFEAGARLDVDPTGEHACRVTQSFHCVLPAGMDSANVEVMRAYHRQALVELKERVQRHFGA